MSGILKMALALQMLTMRAKEAEAGINGAGEAIGDLPSADPLDEIGDKAEGATKKVRALYQGIRMSGVAIGLPEAVPTGDDDGLSFGGGDDGPTDIRSQLSQQDALRRIDESPAKRYLDAYMELFIERIEKGFNITPQRAAQIDEALYSQRTGAQDILRRFTGTAGLNFDFSTFEYEIKQLLAAQKETNRNLKKATTNQRGPTSGTLGTPRTETCAPTSNLSLMLHAGAIR